MLDVGEWEIVLEGRLFFALRFGCGLFAGLFALFEGMTISPAL